MAQTLPAGEGGRAAHGGAHGARAGGNAGCCGCLSQVSAWNWLTRHLRVLREGCLGLARTPHEAPPDSFRLPPLRRHLRGRLISSESAHRQHAASDSATSLSRMVGGRGGDEQQPGAESAAGVLANGLSVGMQSAEAAAEGAAGTLHGGAEGMAAGGGACACRREDPDACSGACGNGDAVGGFSYFKRKRAAWLTGGWETAAAFGAVLLLPLVSVVPCSTTALREDAEHVRSGGP